MRPRVEFLLDEVGLDEFEVSEVVTKLSTLFSLSVENSLRPKFHYLRDELGGSKDSLVSFPVYLSLSLAQRIQPRHRYAEEGARRTARSRNGTPEPTSVQVALRCSTYPRPIFSF